MFSGEHNPLPLMTKGENEFENIEVAIKSKGGDCWHYELGWCYGTGVVLDGNSLKWKITIQALKMIEHEIPAGALNKSYGPAIAPNKKCGQTHRSSEIKVRTSNSLNFMQRSVRTWEFL